MKSRKSIENEIIELSSQLFQTRKFTLSIPHYKKSGFFNEKSEQFYH